MALDFSLVVVVVAAHAAFFRASSAAVAAVIDSQTRSHYARVRDVAAMINSKQLRSLVCYT